MSTGEKYTTVPRYRLSLVREAESPYGQRGDLLDRPDAVAHWLWREIYHDAAQEKMSAVFLDVGNRLIGYQVAFVGTLARSAVEPRAVLTAALLCNASAFILAHNHPSGDAAPSAEDLTFTRRMAEAGELLGVKMVDHIILGDGRRWTSLGRRGAW